MNRRSFLHRGICGTAALAALRPASLIATEAPAPLPEATPARLPRWRGFNLLEKFNGENQRFLESDFGWISELGFNFVRLPMDYRAWIEGNDWRRFREATFRDIDDAIAYGEKHGLHVMLNFHRAPGYTVAQPPEEKSVWKEEEALEVCTMHWARFADRYRGIPARRLSFNPFNEPARVSAEDHARVIRTLAEAIHEKDPQRLVICDGRDWGGLPPTELAGLKVAAATRGYQPFKLTHYQASWIPGSSTWEKPTYPLKEGQTVWDIGELKRRHFESWRRLSEQGMGVMVGEFGAYNKTPHPVVLDWMRDLLTLWKSWGWGWALWNFRGGFGVLDSGRPDVQYEEWRGHQLDRAMLKLLQSF